MRLQLNNFEGADFKYDNNFFQILVQIYPNKAFPFPNLVFFYCEILQLDKFEGADFIYDNSIFEILAQKYPNKAFLVPNLDIFVFSKVSQLIKFEVLISNMTIAFSNSSPNIPK